MSGSADHFLAEEKISVAGSGALASIIVPCCGMVEYTKLCVPSILRNTRPPYELIFLDIGSLDGTLDYLTGIKAASAFRVEIIRTPADLGIRDACKEAVGAARGDYLVLLNNDAVVTDGWLQQMIALSNASPAIGMVGPMSNYAPAGQLVETVPYRVKRRTTKGSRPLRAGEALLDVDAMHAFAKEFREERRTKWLQVERLAGFCLLLKREVLDRIGLANLEKGNDLSLFDTDALSAKARQAGFTLAVCRDLFVHHFGTRSFARGSPARTNSQP